MKPLNQLLLLSALMVLTFRADATTYFVNVSNTVPLAPYTNWTAAATNIQDAIDAASDGALVLVTNGVYATGGRRWFDSGTNRVTLTNAVTLQSVNGPSVTLIVGNRVVGTGAAQTNTARCVYMTRTNAILSGFTLTNGEAGTGNYPSGGGVVGGIATNCVLVGNLATNNYGGAAFRGFLVNCKIISNSALYGGGASDCTLVNSLITGNSAINYGGGAYSSLLVNCTVVANHSGQTGGGSSQCVNNSCILFNNSAVNVTNGIESNYEYWNGYRTNCCSPYQDTHGFNNNYNGITNDPLFVLIGSAGDFHLQSNSPCINAGKNLSGLGNTDLDGNPRIVGGTVDIGAYEYQSPSSILSYAWAQQYGLPTDGSADFIDSDGDGMNNWQEWIAGIVPTNAASVLLLNPPTNAVTGLQVSWPSVSTRTYFLQRSTNLPAFTALQSNLVGGSVTTTFMDTSATNGGSYFYRVGVQ